MKKDDRKMLTIAVAVAAVGTYYYYRNRKKGLAAAEKEAQVLRYSANELAGIQVDMGVGDLLEITTPGAEQPNWDLSTQYPSNSIELANLGNGNWVWRVRGVIPEGSPPSWVLNLHDKTAADPNSPDAMREFTLKVHPA